MRTPKPSNTLNTSLQPVHFHDKLAILWLDLERRSDPSFFQSWAWIGCWLRHLPAELQPLLLTISTVSEVVGLGLLVARPETRHGVLQVRGLHLNETGDTRIDPLGLEYSGLIVDRRYDSAAVARVCLTAFSNEGHKWDEINLGGLEGAPSEFWIAAAETLGWKTRIRAEKRCDFVDLEALQHEGHDYLDSLSRNTRQQIRRAMRLYELAGPLSIVAAGSTAEALDFLDGLRDLHQASWVRRGFAGAFGKPIFDRFHHALVAEQFGAGEIQLLRISAGARSLGYLYNFLKDGKVYAYQSGFKYGADPRLKPGLVSHALAIRHNLEHGARVYDFMAGNSRYKQSLGTDHLSMKWLVLQRPTGQLRLENALRTFKKKLPGQTQIR